MLLVIRLCIFLEVLDNAVTYIKIMTEHLVICPLHPCILLHNRSAVRILVFLKYGLELVDCRLVDIRKPLDVDTHLLGHLLEAYVLLEEVIQYSVTDFPCGLFGYLYGLGFLRIGLAVFNLVYYKRAAADYHRSQSGESHDSALINLPVFRLVKSL